MAKRKKHRGTAALMVTVVLLFMVFVGALMLLFMMPGFDLSQNTVTLEAGDRFSALSYVAAMKNASTADLEISGTVNPDVPGEYAVTYRLGMETQTLTVIVRDTTPPVIQLFASAFTIKEGETLDVSTVAKGVDKTEVSLRLDAKGQDLTVPGVYSLTVLCTDTAGNRSEAAITLTVEPLDTNPPEITGAEDITIMVGDFFDPQEGVCATDDLDPAPVLTVDAGSFDGNKAGTYTITYTARDSHGNTASRTRTVTVTSDYVPVMYASQGGTYQWDARGIEDQPYLVCVNRAMCTITVYGKDDRGNYTVPVKAICCSVAREGHTTPLGRFRTTDRYTWCYMVDGSYGRYAIRIRGGIMFHSVCYYSTDISDLEYEEYNKLGSPASLGCIRMCVADEKWLYDNCPTGFPVEIYDDAGLSGPLGKPEPIRIDVTDTARRGWDPTDWDPKNPWNP